MWKNKLIFVNISIALFLFVLTSNAYAYSNASAYVKVGIKYASTATSTVNLQSKGGFRAVKFEKDNSCDIASIQSESISTKKMGYTIRIDNEFNTYEEALGVKNELNDLGIKAYILYDDKYLLNLGGFDLKSDALFKIKDIYNSVTKYGISVSEPNKDVLEMKDSDGNIAFAYNTNYEIGFKGNSGYVSVDGKKYRGNIILKPSAGVVNVISKMLLDEYLYGVVPREMSNSWPKEALKAQAVAARNYAMTNAGKKHAKDGFDVCTTDHCQVYGGVESEGSNATNAVNETSGKVMTYNDSLIDALFHSNSGGKTDDSENVYVNKVPYLRGVDDSYSIGYPNDNWSVGFTKSDIEAKLSASKIDIGSLVDVKVDEKSTNGRVLKIRFIGTKGEKTYLKDSARTLLGLKSTYFDISKDEGIVSSINQNQVIGNSKTAASYYLLSSDSSKSVTKLSGLSILSQVADNTLNNSNYIYVLNEDGVKKIEGLGDSIKASDPKTNLIVSSKYVFNGHGWGHGIGMSQWGAKKMAETGLSYEDILKHYYTGIQIVN